MEDGVQRAGEEKNALKCMTHRKDNIHYDLSVPSGRPGSGVDYDSAIKRSRALRSHLFSALWVKTSLPACRPRRMAAGRAAVKDPRRAPMRCLLWTMMERSKGAGAMERNGEGFWGEGYIERW